MHLYKWPIVWFNFFVSSLICKLEESDTHITVVVRINSYNSWPTVGSLLFIVMITIVLLLLIILLDFASLGGRNF